VQKLYVNQDGGDQLVTLVAKLMQLEDLQVVRVPDDQDEAEKIRKKSLTGRFPILETSTGVVLSESLPIARYLAREHPSFLGQSEAERKWNFIEVYHVTLQAPKLTCGWTSSTRTWPPEPLK
jgi:glutathione S-transferase